MKVNLRRPSLGSLPPRRKPRRKRRRKPRRKAKANAKAKAKAKAKAAAQAKTKVKAAKPARQPESNQDGDGEEHVETEEVTEPSKTRKARKVRTGTTKSEPKIPKTKDLKDVASAEGPEVEPKPKRKRSEGGDVSFARRPPPTRRDGWAYYRWQAIRDVFESELKNLLEKQSSHQDLKFHGLYIYITSWTFPRSVVIFLGAQLFPWWGFTVIHLSNLLVIHFDCFGLLSFCR